MERNYYPINEKEAKTAHSMMSFNEYKEGSKTSEYKEYVDQAYKLADEIAETKTDCADRVYNMADRYSGKMAEYFNKDFRIGCMCPSVMISGSGNFPVRKKEKQNQAWERNHKFFDEIQEILKKMESIMYGNDMIMSGDENAVAKLEEKLKNLKANQEKMKSANRAIRMKNIKKGDGLLKVLGFTAKEIKNLRTPDFCGRIGYPDYALRNNNANIRRIEARLKNLKAVKEKGTSESENQFFKVIENTELMRLQLIFDEKPDSKVRDILKQNGFRWAPSSSAWQRQLTNHSRCALEKVIEQLENLKKSNNYEEEQVMFESELNNCVPEYFRLEREQYEHECELEYERQEHYDNNRKKVEDAEAAGYSLLFYGGYEACWECKNADHDTNRGDDDIGIVICKNPDCPEHQKHLND